MDVFNRLLTQINDLFKSMSPGARITTGLLLVAVVVSLGYLFNAQSAGADAYLLNGQSFTADEMAQMEGAFGKAGLSDYTVEGSRIKISRSRQAAFLGALADAGAMPANFGSYLTEATSAGSGISVDRIQREEMLKVAKQKELALVIRSMQGIENAAVYYDVQKPSGFQKPAITTASVSVKTRGQLPLPETQVAMIRSLVAASIAGLTPEKVTIADLNGGRTYTHGGGPAGGAYDDAYLSRVREYQVKYETSARERLSYIPGVLVSAGVELDRKLVENIVKTEIDKQQVALSTKSQNSSTNSVSSGPAGRPGLAQQQANAPLSLPGGGGSTQTEVTNELVENNFVVPHGTITTQMAGLTPKRVTFSIGVPSSYLEKIWLQRNPPEDGAEPEKPDPAELTAIQDEELKKVREAIVQLIPPPPDATGPVDLMQFINVATFASVPLPEPIGPSFVDELISWLAQSWNSVAMLVLALMALMMLRSFVKAVPAAPEMPSIMSTTVDGDDEVETNDIAAADRNEPTKSKQRTLQRKAGGPSLREELVEMVREDPDAAANILRGWIGNAT